MQTKDLVPSDSHTVQKTLALGLLAGAILTANAVANADSNTNANLPTSELTPPSDTPTADIPVTTEAPQTEAPSEVVTSEETPVTTTDAPSTDVPQTTENKPSELKPAEELPVTTETSETTEATTSTEATTTDKADIPVVTEKPKPAVEVPQTNDTGRETILHPQETGTPTVTPTNDAPVITDQGYKVVDIAKSILTLENADGSLIKVNPELVGGVTNEDGTVSIKNSKGELETLPETSSVESILITFIGFLLLLFGFTLVNKAKHNNYTYL